MALYYWSAGSGRDEPVNANQAIRAAGGGPKERVAIHVKQQQAGIKHVRDDSTCVHGKFWELAQLKLYVVHLGRSGGTSKQCRHGIPMCK